MYYSMQGMYYSMQVRFTAWEAILGSMNSPKMLHNVMYSVMHIVMHSVTHNVMHNLMHSVLHDRRLRMHNWQHAYCNA